MSIFAKLFKKKTTEEESARVGGMEDFMTLIRVYYQAVMAAQLGISNINALPDMAVFKRTLKIPTQNNKLGVAERSRCKKMLTDIYGINEFFFKEIDASIKKHCKNVNAIQNYLFMFQGFSQDLMMVVGNLMQWKFRMPRIFNKALRGMTEKTVHDILTKTTWKDDSVRGMCSETPAKQCFRQVLGNCGAYRHRFAFEATPRMPGNNHYRRKSHRYDLCANAHRKAVRRKQKRIRIRRPPASPLPDAFFQPRLSAQIGEKSRNLPDNVRRNRTFITITHKKRQKDLEESKNIVPLHPQTRE